MVRGGSWNNDNPENLRVAHRNNNNPGNRNNNVGLRLLSTSDLPEDDVYGFRPRAQGIVQVMVLCRQFFA